MSLQVEVKQSHQRNGRPTPPITLFGKGQRRRRPTPPITLFGKGQASTSTDKRRSGQGHPFWLGASPNPTRLPGLFRAQARNPALRNYNKTMRARLKPRPHNLPPTVRRLKEAIRLESLLYCFPACRTPRKPSPLTSAGSVCRNYFTTHDGIRRLQVSGVEIRWGCSL